MDLRQLVLDAIEYLFGMWRHRWVALGVAWLTALGGWAWALSLPNEYEAESRVFVDTRSILQPLLRDMTVTGDTMTQVRVVTQMMLSRPQLEAVAVQTGLDSRARTDQEKDALLERIRRNVTIRQLPRSEIFSIGFRDEDPVMARSVVQALLENFMESALGKERTDSLQAQRFLEQQIRAYEQRLEDAEDRLAEFRKRNVGLLPGQGGDYFARLQAAEAAKRELESEIASVNERRRELMRQMDAMSPTLDTGEGTGPIPTSQDEEIARKEQELNALRIQYTDRHPQVQRLLATLETLYERQVRERERLQSTAGRDREANLQMELNPVYRELRIALSEAQVELASLRERLRERQENLDFLHRMVDTIPEVEAQLTRLNRDYDIVRSQYDRLVQRLESARLSEEVQLDTEGVTFEVIEPPRTPLAPSAPNRPLLLAGVLVVGLGTGTGVGLLLSLHAPVFFSGQRLASRTGLPVFGMVGYSPGRRQLPVNFVLFLFATGSLFGLFVALLGGGAEILMELRQLI